MNSTFRDNGWNVSKNGNLYKIIDGECYSVGHWGEGYTIYSSGIKVEGLNSLEDAKAKVFELAYENYRFGDSGYFENFNTPMFKALVKEGYKQLAKKYHPDISKNDGERMKELNNLYDDICQDLDI